MRLASAVRVLRFARNPHRENGSAGAGLEIDGSAVVAYAVVGGTFHRSYDGGDLARAAEACKQYGTPEGQRSLVILTLVRDG
jgi:hypothetical protein